MTDARLAAAVEAAQAHRWDPWWDRVCACGWITSDADEETAHSAHLAAMVLAAADAWDRERPRVLPPDDFDWGDPVGTLEYDEDPDEPREPRPVPR